MTDIPQVDVYQLKREPQTWAWIEDSQKMRITLNKPVQKYGKPVLVISLSATVTLDRITSVLGDDLSVWMVTVDEPHQDLIKSKSQLGEFRVFFRRLMDEIKAVHGQKTTLYIFPASPIAVSIELGRIRQPKADMPWLIYDQVNKLDGFVKTLLLS